MLQYVVLRCTGCSLGDERRIMRSPLLPQVTERARPGCKILHQNAKQPNLVVLGKAIFVSTCHVVVRTAPSLLSRWLLWPVWPGGLRRGGELAA